jgi:hypothetical protein
MWKTIENYINQNRQAIDLDEPGAQVWRNIENRLNASGGGKIKTGLGRFRYLKAAAAVVVSVGLGYLLANLQPNTNALSSSIDVVACEEKAKQAERMEESYLRSVEIADSAKGYDPGTYPKVVDYLRGIEELRPEYQDLKDRLQKEDCTHELIHELEDHTLKRRELMHRFSDHLETIHR